MCSQGAKGTAADKLRLGLVQLLAAESPSALNIHISHF
jgi:hypothetical protein